jgi:glycosyltransferase involved in cell wall biosynthesis
MTFFTVIIPTYNRCVLTERAIESVLNQTDQDFTLIVIDDGSTDNTPLLQNKYKSQITYIRQNNRGVSAARNRGIAEAESPYIALLDSDDTWHSNKLAEHRSFIAEHDSIRIHQTEDKWIRNGRAVNPRLKHRKQAGDIFIPSLDLCLISPSSVVMEKSVFNDYGLFDEDLPACEDYDLWLRITAHEPVGLIEKQLITRYAGHDDQLSAAFWGMDRFRVYALIKLLTMQEDTLSAEQIKAVRNKALEKSRILLGGAQKRGNKTFMALLEKTITSLEDECYNCINYQSLVTVQ